jgi:hypothetical protein
MATQAPTLSPVKITLERWLQDKAEAAGVDFNSLADEAGMTRNKLTICIKHPERATLQEVRGLAEVLELDWYDDLVAKWGFGKCRITLDEADTTLHTEGAQLGRVQHAA